MKEKEIAQIIKALDQIGAAVRSIKTVLVQSGQDRSLSQEQSATKAEISSSQSTRAGLSEEKLLPSVDAHSANAGESEKDTSSSPIDGFLDVLDLSGDIKKVQLALMRLGKGTVAEVAQAVSLDVDEVRIYLKTLMRDSAIVAHSSKDSETVYRTVLRKKGKKPSKGASSLLDKLV